MNLTIKQSTTLTENSSSSNIVETLYQLTKPDPLTGLPSANAVLVGKIQVPAAYEDAVSFLNSQFSASNSDNGSDLQITVLNNNYYIRFADPEVVRVLTEKGYMQEDEGLTVARAKSISLGLSWFSGNTSIESFNEAYYFKGTFESGCFQNCSNLVSIDLTNATSIGQMTFQGCANLEKFNGADSETGVLSLPNLVSWASYPFNGCKKIKRVTSLGSVTNLAHRAFMNCPILTEITLPQSCVSLLQQCCSGCNSLTTINISQIQNFGTAGGEHFINCSNLEYFNGSESIRGELYLPNVMGVLRGGAFKGCAKLLSITSLGSITSIGDNAFENCINLANITFPGTLTSVGYNAFKNTAWYNSQPQGPIIIGKSLYKIKGTVGTSYTIPNTVEYITKNALGDVIELEELTIPNSVTGLNSLFVDDGSAIPSSLTTIHLNANVTTIPDSFARYLSSLQTFEIPSYVTKIGNYAFDRCNLSSINIPASVTSISSTSFQSNVNCASITVDANNTVYDSRNNCNAIIISNSNILLTGCKNTIIPNTVTEIGEYAFYKCKGLFSISIPNGVTKLANHAFSTCSDLTTISLPSTLKEVGSYALGATPFTSLIFPEGFEKIDTRAFENGLRNCIVDFPTTLNYVGNNCMIRASFSRIIFRGSIHNITFGTDVFFSSGDCPVYVRDDEVDDWTDEITTNPSSLRHLEASRLKPLSELPT